MAMIHRAARFESVTATLSSQEYQVLASLIEEVDEQVRSLKGCVS
jgi:hypothetical protein